MATFRGYSTIDKRFGNFVLEDVQLAKRDLLNHFYTRKGERIHEPEFGSILPDLVFEPLVPEVVDQVEDDVRTIVRTDPRWTLKDLNIEIGEHSITCHLDLVYNPTTTIEYLYLKFTAEEEN